MMHCSRVGCGRYYDDGLKRCPHCGSSCKQAEYEPSAEDIASGCERVQAQWTEDEEQKRRAQPNPPAELTVAIRYPKGRRRTKEVQSD